MPGVKYQVVEGRSSRGAKNPKLSTEVHVSCMYQVYLDITSCPVHAQCDGGEVQGEYSRRPEDRVGQADRSSQKTCKYRHVLLCLTERDPTLSITPSNRQSMLVLFVYHRCSEGGSWLLKQGSMIRDGFEKYSIRTSWSRGDNLKGRTLDDLAW